MKLGLVAALIGANAVLLHAAPADEALTPDEQTGGATTVAATGRNAFSFAAANLSDDERTRFVFIRKVGQIAGGQHDILDRFAAVRFHERHMLVRGRVDDNLGARLGEERLEASAVGQVREANVDMRHFAIRRKLQKLTFQMKLPCLRTVDQHKQCRLQLQKLSADF